MGIGFGAGGRFESPALASLYQLSHVLISTRIRAKFCWRPGAPCLASFTRRGKAQPATRKSSISSYTSQSFARTSPGSLTTTVRQSLGQEWPHKRCELEAPSSKTSLSCGCGSDVPTLREEREKVGHPGQPGTTGKRYRRSSPIAVTKHESFGAQTRGTQHMINR